MDIPRLWLNKNLVYSQVGDQETLKVTHYFATEKYTKMTELLEQAIALV